jgi:hypothetical protein
MSMSKVYIDLFLKASQFYFFFDKEKAEEEAKKQEQKGNETKIYKERECYTVFIFNH